VCCDDDEVIPGPPGRRQEEESKARSPPSPRKTNGSHEGKRYSTNLNLTLVGGTGREFSLWTYCIFPEGLSFTASPLPTSRPNFPLSIAGARIPGGENL